MTAPSGGTPAPAGGQSAPVGALEPWLHRFLAFQIADHRAGDPVTMTPR